jgi:hypothetical protein
MNSKHIILIFTALVGGALSYYIMGVESKSSLDIDPHDGHNHEPTIQVANRGETKITLKSGYSQIGRLQAKIPNGWKRIQPSSSMRIAQFEIPTETGSGELVVFSGIGGSVEANLERWYGQFRSNSQNSITETAEKFIENINGMDVTFSFAEGTYLKSSMGMGGVTTEMPNYSLMAAIIIAPDGPYFFKGTGPKIILKTEKEIFISFIKSIEQL